MGRKKPNVFTEIETSNKRLENTLRTRREKKKCIQYYYYFIRSKEREKGGGERRESEKNSIRFVIG